jgi:hypothetical protein
MSPYIITTKRPGEVFPLADQGWHISRRAVATLEGANEAVHRIAHDLPGKWQITTLAKYTPLPESGGTVGPLPNGTVIEVEQVGWSELARLAGRTRYTVPPDEPVDPDGLSRKGWQVILDAYNARQA